jgi:ABC-2 type transport system permease protein
MLTYVSVGWIIRSFYWNTIDQEMAYEVIEGKISMDLIKPVSIEWMWIFRAMGESAFRLGLLTLPTALVVAFVFPVQAPASRGNFAIFLAAVLGSFFLMGAINFMIGTCAIPLKSILALIRAKYWLVEMLSGLLIPMAFFPEPAQRVLAWLPFEHIAYTPLQIYLGKLNGAQALRTLGIQWIWVAVLLSAARLWWNRSVRNITIHGG